MNAIDFLRKPSDIRLRKEIQNICDSYSHPWDLLAELCQNAIDAIRLHIQQHGARKQHNIEIVFNVGERSIKVRDSGIGFDPHAVADLLAPHGTDKDMTNTRVIGQKGVGLTYVIFMCDKLSLTTSSAKGAFSGSVEGANSWKKGKSSAPPKLSIKETTTVPAKPQDTFTEVHAQWIEEGYAEPTDDIFAQNDSVLQLVLRTKTAIGSTTSAFDDEPEEVCKVVVTVKRPSSKAVTFQIPPTYLTPSLLVNKNQLVNLHDFEKEASKLNDKQKTQRLQGKCLWVRGSKQRAGRTIKYYGFYVPSRSTWTDICAKNKFFKPDDADDDIPTPLYYGGILVATRKMPTGIELTPPFGGSAGYWANNFILLEDNSLTFDLGRKSVPSRTQGILRDIAKELFQDFRSWSGYLSTDPEIRGKLSNVAGYEKYKTFDALRKLPDLNVRELPYLKHPNEQEAAVAALFHELVGANLLKGYRTLRTGFKESYDLWGLYETRKEWTGENHHSKITEGEEIPLIIEFKYAAEAILSDFEDNKFFGDIDLIVCWDLDPLKFAKNNVAVRVVAEDDQFIMLPVTNSNGPVHLASATTARSVCWRFVSLLKPPRVRKERNVRC